MKYYIVTVEDSKIDQDKFIEKFGEDNFNKFNKLKDRLKNNGISVDLTWHTKNTTPEDMDEILSESENRVVKEKGGKVKNNSVKVYEDSNYTIYEIPDWETAMNLGEGTVWCISGRYNTNGQVKPSQAKQYFNQYLNSAYSAYYYVYDKKKNTPSYCICSRGDSYDIWDKNDNTLSKLPNLFVICDGDGYLSFYNKDINSLDEMSWDDIKENLDSIEFGQYKNLNNGKCIYIGNREWIFVYDEDLPMYDKEHFNEVFDYNRNGYDFDNGYKVSYEDSDMKNKYLPMIQSTFPNDLQNAMTSDLDLLDVDELKKYIKYLPYNYYWTRSPSYNDANSFCGVSHGGGANYDYADSTIGVAPCFAM